MNVSDPPTPKVEIVFAVITVLIGAILVIVSRSTNWSDGSTIGWIIVGIGVPYLLWRLYLNLADLNIIGIILFMRKEKLLAIMKDKKKNKKLISDRFYVWAQKKDASIIKVKGVTLNLVFGNNGLLKELTDEKKLVFSRGKKIRALLLNPYAMSAINRSIQESPPFEKIASSPVEAICQHTLDKHKRGILYKDFFCTVENIQDLMKNSGDDRIDIECRIYSTISPSFLLIDDQRAISENLILGRNKNDPEGKLYGILPHLIYSNGDIKDSLENHFDYIWNYDSVALEDFHENVEEKNYEINRLFMLYNLQKQIWNRQYDEKGGRSLGSVYDILYQVYKEFYSGFSPKRILDLGCGDGGGGSLTILREYPDAKIDFNDISEIAIKIFKDNVRNEQLDSSNAKWIVSDMLTFLNHCEPDTYSLVYANFSIIYMTKIKAVEIFRKIFNALQSGGILMLSVWTTQYFNMPISKKHGEKGFRPPHIFVRIPMTEDLQVLVAGSEKRIGEIRRFYRSYEELLEEIRSADENHTLDYDNIHHEYYENGAVLRVWLRKK